MGVEHLKKAHLYLPDNVEIMLKLAVILFKEYNQTEESLSLITQVVRLAPNNTEALLLLGKIYDKLTRYQEAADVIDQAIKLMAA